MVGEVINSIKDAETEAARIMDEANIKSKSIYAQSRQKASALLAEAEEQALIRAQKMLAEAEAGAKAKAEQEKQKSEQKCDDMKIRAKTRVDEAVEIIIERIG